MLAFGHMLPHSVHVLESIGSDKNMAFKFTLLGYLLVFFIEKIAFDGLQIMHEHTVDQKDNNHQNNDITKSCQHINMPNDSNIQDTNIQSNSNTYMNKVVNSHETQKKEHHTVATSISIPVERKENEVHCK